MSRTALYRKPVPTFWWLGRRSYAVFVLRELSSVFIAWFVVFLLLMAGAIAEGSGEYRRFQDWSANWWVVLLNVIALLFVLLHTVTWFGLAPRAMVVRLRGRRVRPRSIVALHYLLWALLTAAVAWLILDG
ncbi:fumarate reductase subunit C [Streptomyces sannanensis]|uniref:Fumarate reductase subunit C n=1 Tax=Streptomyces sannanensis TaxID=285536 RepID=A0ABP6SL23_9ACTN